MRKQKFIRPDVSRRMRKGADRRIQHSTRVNGKQVSCGQTTEAQIEEALSAILALTQGGVENARKVIARVLSDGEAAALIARASWGSMGGVMVANGAGYVEGRNQTIMVRIGEVKMTLTPAQWVSRVRRMLSQEADRCKPLTTESAAIAPQSELGSETWMHTPFRDPVPGD